MTAVVMVEVEVEVEQAVRALRALLRWSCVEEVQVGVICGSGLQGLSAAMENTTTIPYDLIPGFPTISAPDHVAELVFGRVADVACVCMRGRYHHYEGHSVDAVTFPIKVLRQLGVKVLIVTNACGGINPRYQLGDIAVLHDHFGMPTMCGYHPQPAEVLSAGAAVAHDPELRRLFAQSAQATRSTHKVRLDATYAYLGGPYYQTFAECRMLKSAGADCVGMSSAPEVAAAQRLGVRVLALALVCSREATSRDQVEPELGHAAFMEIVRASSADLQATLRHMLCSAELQAFLAALPTVPRLCRCHCVPNRGGYVTAAMGGAMVGVALGWLLVLTRRCRL